MPQYMLQPMSRRRWALCQANATKKSKVLKAIMNGRSPFSQGDISTKGFSQPKATSGISVVDEAAMVSRSIMDLVKAINATYR